MQHVNAPSPATGRARDAIRHPDFVRLLAMRLLSQTADGFIQAALVASLVFSPDKQSTASGFAVATAIVVVPFSLMGPFAGVFIDRWSRRRIMVIAPLLRAAPVFLLLLSPHRQPVLFYAGALWVTSVNRFFLSTAQAVVPRLVPTEDLLTANSIATVGGTVALLVGVFAGGLISERPRERPHRDRFGGDVGGDLRRRPRRSARTCGRTSCREAPALLRHQVRRVGTEFAEGIRDLRAHAVGARADRVHHRRPDGAGARAGAGVGGVPHLFVEGVGSFSWLIGAGGVGVFAGLLTVGRLASRLPRPRLVAWSFVLGGHLADRGGDVPDPRHRPGGELRRGPHLRVEEGAGRHDGAGGGARRSARSRVLGVRLRHNMARLAAALLAIPLLAWVHARGAAAFIGAVFLLWAPVLPAWLRHAPMIRLRFDEGEERPRATVVGRGRGAGAGACRRDRRTVRGAPRTLRLALADGTVMDVSRPSAGRRVGHRPRGGEADAGPA